MPDGYGAWLAEVKERIQSAQQRATLAVNTELITLYWQIGREILDRQAQQGWGGKVVERLAHDLRAAFPDMTGWSRTNLLYMRAFADAWPEDAIVQQAVGRLPWGHNLVLLTKLKAADERLAYAAAALEHGWSRSVLEMQIDARTVERTGRAVTNFERTLAAPQERAIEQALVDHVAEYALFRDLPEPLATSLPTIEQIEHELQDGDGK